MRTLLISLLVTLSATSYAQSYGQEIYARQSLFAAIEKQSGLAEYQLDKKQPDWQQVEKISLALTEHAKNLKTSFPKGGNKDSKAKSAIWDNPEKFNQLMTEMDEGFQALYRASKNQDLSSAQAGLEQAQDTCNSCHRKYRSLW